MGAANEPLIYEILVHNHLDARWSEWLTGMSIEHLEGGVCALHGVVVDQAALEALISKLIGMNVTLLSVRRVDAQYGSSGSRGPRP